jgi:exonuclease VII small subunit
MPRSNRDKALRAFQEAIAREHRAQERALASDDIDDALSAWLEAMHATRRASHALRSAEGHGAEEPSTG